MLSSDKATNTEVTKYTNLYLVYSQYTSLFPAHSSRHSQIYRSEDNALGRIIRGLISKHQNHGDEYAGGSSSLQIRWLFSAGRLILYDVSEWNLRVPSAAISARDLRGDFEGREERGEGKVRLIYFVKFDAARDADLALPRSFLPYEPPPSARYYMLLRNKPDA